MALVVTKGVMDPINKCLLEADSNPIIHGVHSINPFFVRLTFTSTPTHLHNYLYGCCQLKLVLFFFFKFEFKLIL